MDRRIIRTRQAIMEAFVGLLEEKGFEKVTVQDIADRANVNRGTVYLHFTDKYDLMEQCVETYLQLLYESCMPDGEASRLSAKALLLRTFEFIERHASIYTTLLTNQGVPTFRNRMTAMVEQGIGEHIQSCEITTAGVRPEILGLFLSSAVAGLVEWWIIHSMPYAPEELVEQLLVLLERNLLPPGETLEGR